MYTKNISGVGLGSGTETTRTLVELVWGLGPILQEHKWGWSGVWDRDYKNISGVGLGSGTDTTRTLVGLVWGLEPRLQEHKWGWSGVWDRDYKNISGIGLGPRLQEHKWGWFGTETARRSVGLGLGPRLQEYVTHVHSELYKTVDIETETDHKSTNRFSVVFLITFPHRVITTFTVQSRDQILQNKTFGSTGRGTGNEATINPSYDMPICCSQVGTHYACTSLSVAASTGRKNVTRREKCKVGNVRTASLPVAVVVVPSSQEGTINDG